MQRYTFSQILLFFVVYFAYGSSYLLRMPYGVIKDELVIIYNIRPEYLGYVDLAFLLPYSLVSLTMGNTVQFLGPRLTLSFGLLISVLATCLLTSCDSFVWFLLFVAVSGGSQALCWPASCALISSAFENSKSTVFGFFGSCCFLGGIAGKMLALNVMATSTWAAVFLVPSAIVGIMSCLVLIGGRYFPAMGLKSNEIESTLLPDTVERTVKKVTIWQMLKMPGVAEVSFTMFFIKSIRYIFMFWLPLYMHKALNYTALDAGYASLSFDVGGMFGSCLIGFVSDEFAKGRDMFVCLLSIIFCSISLIAFYYLPNAGWIIHVLILTVSGSFNGGSDVLLSGSVSVKLAKRYGSSSSALTSLTGIVNGMGSVGTVLEGPIVGFFSAWLGWHSMLIVIIGFSAAACIFAARANSLMTHHCLI